MVNGRKKKRKDCRLYTPLFCFGCRNFMNSSTAKRNATFTVHTYIHMYATLLNDELMNETIKKIEHEHFMPRANSFNYIKYYGLLSGCTKQ